jgi:hypothetical protein
VRHARSAAAAVAVVAASLSACSTSAPAAPPATPTVAVPPPSPQTITYPPTVVPSVVESAAAAWTMPNLVGSGLQDAQDAIQELTGYGIAITTSHDATGAHRMQIADRNWKVCTQNVPPGATITPKTQIDFGAVMLDEKC